MVELLSKRYGYAPVDAYMLCSVCADLRISSIVDCPTGSCRFTSRVSCWSNLRDGP